MKVFSFSLTIEGADILTEEHQDALFKAGCGDATFSASRGAQEADFDREAVDFADAVAGAIKAIESTVEGAIVTSVRRTTSLAAAG